MDHSAKYLATMHSHRRRPDPDMVAGFGLGVAGFIHPEDFDM